MVTMFKGNGGFEFDIVGESHYQGELEHIAGPKNETGHLHRCIAAITLDDDNRYDKKAVKVFIIHGKLALAVGHFSRGDARLFRKQLALTNVDPEKLMLCMAEIVGGWDVRHLLDEYDDDYARRKSTGHFGVKLDLIWPLSLDSRWLSVEAERKSI